MIMASVIALCSVCDGWADLAEDKSGICFYLRFHDDASVETTACLGCAASNYDHANCFTQQVVDQEGCR